MSLITLLTAVVSGDGRWQFRQKIVMERPGQQWATIKFSHKSISPSRRGMQHVPPGADQREFND
jgi:hypothetical protein